MTFDPSPYRELYPFESNYLTRHGLRLHYLDEGQGPTLLCVHGNPSWSFLYRDVVKALRDSHRVIVPDHLGCGLSDKPDDTQYDFCYQSRVDDLDALVSSLDIEGPIDLMVHDWGGAIGLGWAVRNPERVRRIVLLNTAAFFKPPDKRLPWQLWLARNTPLGSLLVLGFNAFARGATRFCVTRRAMPALVRRAFCAPYDSWHNRRATLRFVQDIPLCSDDPSYAAIEATKQGLSAFRDHPVLVCWGKQDFVFDDHFLAGWRQIFPQAEYHEYADAGHYVLEDAGEEIIPLVQSFLGASS